MLSLYIAGIFALGRFRRASVLTLAGVMLLAVICSVLGTRPLMLAYHALTSCTTPRRFCRDTRVPKLAEPRARGPTTLLIE